MLNLVIFGPPGAGKGTQSEKIIRHYNLAHISTGDLLRAERAAGSELGKQADEFIRVGELVPDEVVIAMVRNFIQSHSGNAGFIFDGFPRTVKQAEALDTMLREFQSSINVVLGLEVDENELVKRLILRGKTSGRADDQNEDTIRTRFREYQAKTLPLAGYYKEQGKYHEVMGIGEVEEIFSALCTEIDRVKAASL